MRTPGQCQAIADWRRIALVPALLAGLTGCGADKIGDFLSGGASMRVEVEVYKGPLSKEVNVQWAELIAAIHETSVGLTNFNDELLRTATTLGYLDNAVAASPTERMGVKPDPESLYGAAIARIESARVALDTLKAHKDRTCYGGEKSPEIRIEDAPLEASLGEVSATKASLMKAKVALETAIIESQGSAKRAKEANEAVTQFWGEIRKAREHAETAGGTLAGVCGAAGREAAKTDSARKIAKAEGEMRKIAVAISAVEGWKGMIPVDPVSEAETLNRMFAAEAFGALAIRPHHRGDMVDADRIKSETRVVARVQGHALGRGQHGYITWCNSPDLRKKLLSIFDSDSYADCMVLAQIHDDIDHLIQIKGIFYDDSDKVVKIADHENFVRLIEKAAEIGARFKAKAFYWAQNQTVAPSDTRAVRSTVVSFANMAAEYGNQIGSRADVLLKQCRTGGGTPLSGNPCQGTHRDQLPLSAYLREINPTEFLNLFVYNRATSRGTPIAGETLTRPFWELGSEETRDRVRVMEHLFADHNWSRINTVHANGRGDVAMAFIKDDIGNWNLKSFSNDPSELLGAYQKLTQAAVGAAAGLASGGGTAGVNKVLDLAGRFARGRTSGGSVDAGGINLAALRQATENQINRAADRRKEKEEKIPASPATASPSDIKKKKEARQGTYKELRAILVQYDAMLESLQASVAAGATSDQSGVMDQLDQLRK